MGIDGIKLREREKGREIGSCQTIRCVHKNETQENKNGTKFEAET